MYILQNNTGELRIITYKQNKVNGKSIMIDEVWEELKTGTVRTNRAIKRSTRHRAEQVTIKINKECRDKERIEQSKQKQYYLTRKRTFLFSHNNEVLVVEKAREIIIIII